MQTIENKYALLLLNYCLELKRGEKLYVSSSTAAEPLLRELHREGTKMGVFVVIDMKFEGQGKIFLDNATDDMLGFIPPSYEAGIKEYDAYLNVRAPFNLKSNQNVDRVKNRLRSEKLKPMTEIYFERTANRDLKRSLCQYPTQASAQEAGMSLEEYRHFVFNACKLYAENPQAEWEKLGRNQQQVVDFLNASNEIRYYNPKGTDISFSVEGRTWINSDGKTNMPSGEVFSGPVEDSVNGTVYFSYPSIFMGKEVRGITLEVKDGQVVKYGAETGQDILETVFGIDGARFFGEVAIGTNYTINTATKNILFDEKIGGTIHMAVGQSYKQTGGKNQSSIHWDMITDMTNGGQIFADGKLIYENGRFLEFEI